MSDENDLESTNLPYRRIEEKTGRFAPASMGVAILSILPESNKEPDAEKEETNTTRHCVCLEAYAGDAVNCTSLSLPV